MPLPIVTDETRAYVDFTPWETQTSELAQNDAALAAFILVSSRMASFLAQSEEKNEEDSIILADYQTSAMKGFVTTYYALQRQRTVDRIKLLPFHKDMTRSISKEMNDDPAKWRRIIIRRIRTTQEPFHDWLKSHAEKSAHANTFMLAAAFMWRIFEYR